MKKILSRVLPVVLAASLLVACGGAAASTTTNAAQGAAISTASTAAQTAATSPAQPVATAQTTFAAVVAAENTPAHVEATDITWDESGATRITLTDNAITVDGRGADAAGSQVRITSAGTYVISGKLADGQIIVDTADDDTVNLVLDGVEVNNADSAALYIADAEAAAIILADGSDNRLADGAVYTFADAAEDEPNATLFSKADLTIGGAGALTIEANYNDGITSKDGLAVTGGMITVNAADDGLRGKDYLVIEDGALTIVAGGDGLKADNEEDAALGYISIQGGLFDIDAGGDAIAAQTDVLIFDGAFTLTSGGGSRARVAETQSAKGIKGGANVSIEGGAFVIDAADDAIHANAHVVINGGSFTIATGDDGVHADASLEINGGALRVTTSYEGLESAVITVNGGDLSIVASDDGINVAGDNDGAAMGMPGRPGQDVFNAANGQSLNINGGYIAVDANGDGLDANGAINMTGGTVIVNGPTQQMNGALDHSGFTISGGVLLAVGSAGMAQGPSESSTQYTLMHTWPSIQSGGTLIHIEAADGQALLTFAPAKAYQSIVVSSPEIQNGATYVIYTDGHSTGVEADGLYSGGVYTPGAQVASYTISSIVTGTGAGMGGMPGMRGGRGGGMPPAKP